MHTIDSPTIPQSVKRIRDRDTSPTKAFGEMERDLKCLKVASSGGVRCYVLGMFLHPNIGALTMYETIQAPRCLLWVGAPRFGRSSS